MVQGRRIKSKCEEVQLNSCENPVGFHCVSHHQTADIFTGEKRKHEHCGLNNGLTFYAKDSATVNSKIFCKSDENTTALSYHSAD